MLRCSDLRAGLQPAESVLMVLTPLPLSLYVGPFAYMLQWTDLDGSLQLAQPCPQVLCFVALRLRLHARFGDGHLQARQLLLGRCSCRRGALRALSRLRQRLHDEKIR